ncbi:MAG: hypothetical protein ACOY5F_18940 [Pseudomonadota bacterium]
MCAGIVPADWGLSAGVPGFAVCGSPDPDAAEAGASAGALLDCGVADVGAGAGTAGLLVIGADCCAAGVCANTAQCGAISANDNVAAASDLN